MNWSFWRTLSSLAPGHSHLLSVMAKEDFSLETFAVPLSQADLNTRPGRWSLEPSLRPRRPDLFLKFFLATTSALHSAQGKSMLVVLLRLLKRCRWKILCDVRRKRFFWNKNEGGKAVSLEIAPFLWDTVESYSSASDVALGLLPVPSLVTAIVSLELSLHEPKGEPANMSPDLILVKHKQTSWEPPQCTSTMEGTAIESMKVTKSSLQWRGHAAICVFRCVNTSCSGTILGWYG